MLLHWVEELKKKCFFVWRFSSDSRIFSLVWRHHHYRWRAVSFDICSTLMPLNNEVSLVYCYTGHQLKMIISEDTHIFFLAFGSGTVTTCLFDRGLSRLGFDHPPSPCGANALTHCSTAAAKIENYLFI